MQKNVGDADRMARILLGVGLLSVPVILTLPASAEYYALSAIAVVAGVIILISAYKGYCFVYGTMGLSTRRK